MKTMKKTLSLFVLCALLFCNLSFSGTILAFASVVPAESGNEETIWTSSCSHSDDDGVFSYYLEEDVPFEIGSTFTLRFYIKDASTIQSMTHTAVGFTVNGTPTVEDGVVEYSVTHQANVSEPKLEVFYTLNDEDETEVSAGVYGICYEPGLFLSYSSHDAAMSEYLGYMKRTGAFTVDECQQFLSDYYVQKDIESGGGPLASTSSQIPAEMRSTLSAQKVTAKNRASGTQRTFSGVLQWKDASGVNHPCQYTRVHIYWYSSLTPSTLLGTVYTDSNGFYSFTADNSTWGILAPTFYIAIIAGGPNDTTVRDQNDLSYTVNTGALTEDGNHHMTYNHLYYYSNAMGKGMQVAQAANVANHYANQMRRSTDPTIGGVDIIYPATLEDEDDTAYYQNNHIYIPDINVATAPNYSNWDLVMHEYAHHVQHTMGITDNPGGDHYFNVNMIDCYYTTDDTDDEISSTYAKYEGIRLAWAEGWAEIFPIVAQRYHIDTLSNIAGVGNSVYDGYDLESEADALGEGSELSVAAVLYDLYDTNATEATSATTNIPVNSEDFDTVYISHQLMWNYVLDSDAVTFSQFANYLYTHNLVNRMAFGALLEDMNFSAQQIMLNSGSTTNTKTLPTIKWMKGGGSSKYPNDNFTFVIYDENKNQLFQKAGLSGTSTTLRYTLTAAEWNSVLATGGEKFYASVIAYQMGDLNGAPQTGPYYSGYTELPMPETTEVFKGTTATGSIPANKFVWLKVNVTASTRISFYFSGSVNYEADMFTQMIYGTTTNGRIEWNTDSPSSSFRYTLYCSEAQTLYIRLYTADGSAGTYSIIIN